MKITKNMVYKMTDEARELYLYCDNNSRLYRMSIEPLYNALDKKVKKGVFNSIKATIAFYHVATLGAKMYGKEFGNGDGLRIFNVQARWTVACELCGYYRMNYGDKVQGVEK